MVKPTTRKFWKRWDYGRLCRSPPYFSSSALNSICSVGFLNLIVSQPRSAAAYTCSVKSLFFKKNLVEHSVCFYDFKIPHCLSIWMCRKINYLVNLKKSPYKTKKKKVNQTQGYSTAAKLRNRQPILGIRSIHIWRLRGIWSNRWCATSNFKIGANCITLIIGVPPSRMKYPPTTITYIPWHPNGEKIGDIERQ